MGGDIILSIEGITVVSEDNIEKIRNTLVGVAPGAPFKMNVLRAGKVIELTARVSNAHFAGRTEVKDTDARLWHPWLPINHVLRDAAHPLERGSVVAGPRRVQEGARAQLREGRAIPS